MKPKLEKMQTAKIRDKRTKIREPKKTAKIREIITITAKIEKIREPRAEITAGKILLIDLM
jgi:hypothetical protein